MKKIALISLSFITLLSCSNENKEIEKKTTDSVQNIVKTEKILDLDILPISLKDSIGINSTNLEATIYNNGGSFSIGENSTIVKFLENFSMIAPSQLSKNQVGHILFSNKGSHVMLVSVYRNDFGEVYAVIKKDDKTYYSRISGQIAKFFSEGFTQKVQ